MKRIVISFICVCLCISNIVAQGTDTDYLKLAYGFLNRGNKEKAIKAYNVYKQTQKKTDTEFEKQLESYIDQPKDFNFVEKEAEFPGDIFAWLSKNIKYPSICQEQGVQGQVIVQYIVDQDGIVVEPKVMKSTCYVLRTEKRGKKQKEIIQLVEEVDSIVSLAELEEEAIRVVKSMPKWKPACQNNHPVRQRFNLSIKFKLK